MKDFFRLLLTNLIKAVIIITIASGYLIPLFYVTVISDVLTYKKVIFTFVWFVTWAVLSITSIQYLGKNEQN